MFTSLANWIRARPALRRIAHSSVRYIPDVRCTMTVRDLGRLRVRLRRHRWFLWSNFAQSDALALGMFKQMIRPGDVVYDIGANIGLYTRVMHSWFGAGQIMAFEPMRDNFELLQANIALGRIGDRVRAFDIALSDAEGPEELQIDDMTSGTAVLSSVSGGEASAGRREFGLPPLSERVSTITLDALIERENLPPPNMMKIDTEGAEVKVLRGARETLRRHHPRLVLALHDAEKTAATLDLLDELGYLSFGYAYEQPRDVEPMVYRQLYSADAVVLANNNIISSTALADVRDEPVPIASRPALA